MRFTDDVGEEVGGFHRLAETCPDSGTFRKYPIISETHDAQARWSH
jgi:hypothetical protein